MASGEINIHVHIHNDGDGGDTEVEVPGTTGGVWTQDKIDEAMSRIRDIQMRGNEMTNAIGEIGANLANIKADQSGLVTALANAQNAADARVNALQEQLTAALADNQADVDTAVTNAVQTALDDFREANNADLQGLVDESRRIADSVPDAPVTPDEPAPPVEPETPAEPDVPVEPTPDEPAPVEPTPDEPAPVEPTPAEPEPLPAEPETPANP